MITSRPAYCVQKLGSSNRKHISRAVSGNLLPNTRNKLVEEKKRNATFSGLCHSTHVMILNQSPIKRQFSSCALMCYTHQLLCLKWEPMCMVSGCSWGMWDFTYFTSTPVNLNFFLKSCSCLHSGVTSRHFPLTTARRIWEWHHWAPSGHRTDPSRCSLLTRLLLWNKGQVIRRLEGQLICHPLINASVAKLWSRTPLWCTEQIG